MARLQASARSQTRPQARPNSQFAASLLLTALCLGGAGHASHAAGATARAVVPLMNGPNNIDLLGDRTRSVVFVSSRGNGNAHGFSAAAFYVRQATHRSGAASEWYLAPFFSGPDDAPGGRNAFLTIEGADCTLGDLRLLLAAGKPAEVVIATREFGDSYASPAQVRFDYYRLVRNAFTDETGIGRPEFYFDHVRTVRAKRPYCDVNVALDRELGLGTRGLASSDQNGG